MVRPTINSEKHMRQIPINVTMGGTVENLVLVLAAQNPTTVNHVRVGAVVKAVWIELWVMANMNAIGSQTVIVEKLTSGQGGPTFLQMADLHDYTNKKNIFYTTQGLTGENDTNPIPIIRQWIKIPKGKQRFGLGDQLVISLSANLEDLQHCGNVIYKEYY